MDTIEKIIDLVNDIKPKNKEKEKQNSDSEDSSKSNDDLSVDWDNDMSEDIEELFKKYKCISKRLNAFETRLLQLEDSQEETCTITTNKKRHRL
jgi:hypothetical protein